MSEEYTKEQIAEALKQAEAHDSHNRLIRVNEPCDCPTNVLAWAYRRERQQVKEAKYNLSYEKKAMRSFGKSYDAMRDRALQAEATVEAQRRELEAARLVVRLARLWRPIGAPDEQCGSSDWAQTQRAIDAYDAAVREAGKETK